MILTGTVSLKDGAEKQRLTGVQRAPDLIAALNAAAAVVELSPCRASFVRSKSMRSSGVYSSRLRFTWVKEGSCRRISRICFATWSVCPKS